MQRNKLWFVALVTLFAVAARAQNTFPATGNVGIGTASPDRQLKIQPASDNQTILSIINFGNTAEIFTAGDDSSGNGSVNVRNSSNTSNVLLNSNGSSYINGGNLGIGTTNPIVPLDIVSSTSGNSPLLRLSNTSGSTNGSFGPGIILSNGVSGTHPFILNQYQNASSSFQISNGADPFTNYFTITQGGAVGIGTSAPVYSLDVVGQIHTSGGLVFPDGTSQTTAFLPANCGADYAESVEVTGDRTKYEPGDILVIDPNAPGKFLKSNQSYSTLVAGIYSTQPGFVGRLHPKDAKTDETEVPMAMIGRVPTKVTAENGPIKIGDLLVASSTLGHAMKGTDRSLLTGAVIGKALGSLDSGTGVIEVLVTLQ